jgi:membrane-associated phospholipid phosphatase
VDKFLLLSQYAFGSRCRVWIIEADRKIFEYLTLNCNPPWLSWLCEGIGDVSNYYLIIGIFCVAYYWFNSPRFIRFLVACLLLLAVTEGAAYALKILVARPRPAVEWLIYVDHKALGFPSAHAVNTMALAVFMARWFHKSLVVFLLFPLVVGVSRVLANYHYPLDVLGGWIIGATLASLWNTTLNRLRWSRN